MVRSCEVGYVGSKGFGLVCCTHSGQKSVTQWMQPCCAADGHSSSDKFAVLGLLVVGVYAAKPHSVRRLHSILCNVIVDENQRYRGFMPFCGGSVCRVLPHPAQPV